MVSAPVADYKSLTRPYVWRQPDHKNALYADCIGPSVYRKAQGEPVRVWGLLVGARLHVTILPFGHVMNRHWYARTIKQRFVKWLRRRPGARMVQDYERCLRTKEPMAEFKKAGITLVKKHVIVMDFKCRGWMVVIRRFSSPRNTRSSW